MHFRLVLLIAVLLLNPPLAVSFAADRAPSASPADVIRSLLDGPEDLDFGRAKLAIDTLVDPSVDTQATLAEIDAMVATVNRMLGTLPAEAAATSIERMRALRAFLYDSGHWNDNRPFRYDFDDPYGQSPSSRLLPNYLASKKGNCVSMPILFLILGERLGLDVTLSTAPLHVFVKWTDDATGRTYNFEATHGGFARDSHYRKEMPMTDAAIANGVYLKTLTRKEALAMMASTLLDHLLATRRYDDAIIVADVLLKAYPAHAYALVKKGTAYYRMLDQNFMRKYPNEADIPADLLPNAKALLRANQEAFDQAEAMGWRMPEWN